MKVLIIAYLTPPFSGVGSVRVTKFVKFLSRVEGVKLRVLTSTTGAYKDKISNSHCDEIEQADHITRVFSPGRLKIGAKDEGITWIPFLFLYYLKELFFNRPDVVYFNGGPFGHWALAPFCRILGIQYVLDYRDPWTQNPYIPQKITVC